MPMIRPFSANVLVRGVMLTALSVCTVMSQDASAATSTTFSTRAVVVPTCSIGTPGNLAFGAPTQQIGGGNIKITANVDVTATVAITCTPQSPYAVYSAPSGNATGSGDSAVRRMKLSSGAFYIPYSISTASAGGTAIGTTSSSGNRYTATGTGSAQTMTYYGRVPANSYVQDAGGATATGPNGGSYSDTFTFTVSY